MEHVTFHSEESGFCVDPEDATVVVDFDGRQVDYEFGELDEVVLAYTATTSLTRRYEVPDVILLVDNAEQPGQSAVQDPTGFLDLMCNLFKDAAEAVGAEILGVVQV